MEFTNDIYFDNSLTDGKTAKITYAGMLYKNGAENVNLVSGFGSNWDCTSTIPMEKTDNGFVAEIEMKDYDTFNFCFSDGNNWDNNNYSNYISPILPKVNEATVNFDFEFDSLEEFMNSDKVVEFNKDIEFGNDYSASIDDIIEDILGNTVQNSMSNDTESIDEILDSISQESMPEIEALFNELFFEEQTDDEKESIQNVQDIVTTEASDNAELIALFNELFDDVDKPVYVNEDAKFNMADFNLDGLVSDLLEPVISAPVTAQTEESLFDNIEENTITEETSLVALDNALQVSSKKLGFFYMMKKRLTIACYKLFVKAPKEIAKQLGFDIDE